MCILINIIIYTIQIILLYYIVTKLKNGMKNYNYVPILFNKTKNYQIKDQIIKMKEVQVYGFKFKIKK